MHDGLLPDRRQLAQQGHQAVTPSWRQHGKARAQLGDQPGLGEDTLVDFERAVAQASDGRRMAAAQLLGHEAQDVLVGHLLGEGHDGLARKVCLGAQVGHLARHHAEHKRPPVRPQPRGVAQVPKPRLPPLAPLGVGDGLRLHQVPAVHVDIRLRQKGRWRPAERRLDAPPQGLSHGLAALGHPQGAGPVLGEGGLQHLLEVEIVVGICQRQPHLRAVGRGEGDVALAHVLGDDGGQGGKILGAQHGRGRLERVAQREDIAQQLAVAAATVAAQKGAGLGTLVIAPRQDARQMGHDGVVARQGGDGLLHLGHKMASAPLRLGLLVLDAAVLQRLRPRVQVAELTGQGIQDVAALARLNQPTDACQADVVGAR